MIEIQFDDCTIVLHNDRNAAARNLLAALQVQMLKKYQWICQRCGMPMVDAHIPLEGYKMTPYLECPLCKRQAVPQ